MVHFGLRGALLGFDISPREEIKVCESAYSVLGGGFQGDGWWPWRLRRKLLAQITLCSNVADTE